MSKTQIATTPQKGSLEYYRNLAIQLWTKYNTEKKERQKAQGQVMVIEDMFDEYRIAYNAQIKKRTEEAKKMATQEVFSDYAACSRIDDVVKDHKQFNFKITAAAAVLALGVFFMFLVASNESFRQSVNQNMGFIVAGLIAAIIIIYVLFKGRKR